MRATLEDDLRTLLTVEEERVERLVTEIRDHTARRRPPLSFVGAAAASIVGIFLILGAIMGAYLDFLLGVRLQTESQIRQQRLQAYSDYLITRDQMRPI